MFFPSFVASVIVLLAAHVVRTVRWRILLSGCGIYVSNVRPLTALSVGYLFNTLLPFRLGEVVRTWLLSYTTRSRFSTVLGTVVVERLVDLLVVGLIALCAIQYHYEGFNFFPWILAFLLSSFLSLLAINNSLKLRRLIWVFASAFNEQIKAAILHFFFVLLDLLFKRHILRSGMFWGLTVFMWTLYLASLTIFAYANEVGFLEVFSSVYMHFMDVRALLRFNFHDTLLVAYLTLPIPIVLVYANLSGFNAFSGMKGALREISRVDHYAGGQTLGRLHSFRSDELYHSFLDRFFCGQRGLLSDFEQRGIYDVQVHRVFHGGSGAITALVEVNDLLRVRKFASGALAAKLAVQHDWLYQHREHLPLVQVFAPRSESGDYFYDMAYIGGSRGLYEGIHTDSVEKSIGLVDSIVDCVCRFHQLTEFQNADDAVVAGYVDAKVIANFEIIRSEFEDVFEMSCLELNGESFNLSKLGILNNREWFISQLKDRRQSSIHGDLTIENIMLDATGAGKSEWFLIDPNPVNGFQSPLIDFAKLMQSLHLGYEALHKMPRASFSEGKLTVSLHRSSQYERIHAYVLKKLESHLGHEVMREIALHELVNYLRLIPYQLKVSREAGLAFFACLCILVRDFERSYLGKIEQ